MLAKEELLARVFPVEGAETDEAGHQDDDLMTGQTGETDDLIQREPILDHIEQMADIIVVGQHHALRLLRFAPECQMDWRGHDVLIINTNVRAHASCLVDGADGTFR